MNTGKAPSQPRLARLLATLGVLFLFALMNVLVLSAQVSARPDATLSYARIEPLAGVKSTMASIPQTLLPILDFTPVATLYLPIIFHSPIADPTPEPPDPVTPACNPTGGSGGLSPGIYETTVAGLNATVVVGEGYDPQTPTYLAFCLHGDEGNYTQFQQRSHKMTRFVNEQQWIFVAPQSPHQNSWWEDWQGDNGARNEAMAAVFEEMFARYNVCHDIIFGSTLSGGSVFWTWRFFPDKGGDYPVYNVLVCGAVLGNQATQDKVLALGQQPDIVARSSFEYVYGTEDHLYDNIQDSMALYRQAGFEVIKEELPGVGHCVPDAASYIVNHWTDRAAALGVE